MLPLSDALGSSRHLLSWSLTPFTCLVGGRRQGHLPTHLAQSPQDDRGEGAGTSGRRWAGGQVLSLPGPFWRATKHSDSEMAPESALITVTLQDPRGFPLLPGHQAQDESWARASTQWWKVLELGVGRELPVSASPGRLAVSWIAATDCGQMGDWGY